MSSLVDRKISELQGLDTPVLRALWGEELGRPPPKHLSRDLLMRAMAYHIQEKADGVLNKAARKRLGQLADPTSDHTYRSKPPMPRLKPGTRLVREWRGEVHQVTVIDDGFDYREARYTSLSRIAREITGTRWSGPLFFGLRKTSPQTEVSTDDC